MNLRDYKETVFSQVKKNTQFRGLTWFAASQSEDGGKSQRLAKGMGKKCIHKLVVVILLWDFNISKMFVFLSPELDIGIPKVCKNTSIQWRCRKVPRNAWFTRCRIFWIVQRESPTPFGHAQKRLDIVLDECVCICICICICICTCTCTCMYMYM